jgi:hypothetical protein
VTLRSGKCLTPIAVHDDAADGRHIAVDNYLFANMPLLRRCTLRSPRTPAGQEPVNAKNWFEKMNAAVRTRSGWWRNKFTPEELEIIEREMQTEIEWAKKAALYDLPGPRRFDVFVNWARKRTSDKSEVKLENRTGSSKPGAAVTETLQKPIAI